MLSATRESMSCGTHNGEEGGSAQHADEQCGHPGGKLQDSNDGQRATVLDLNLNLNLNSATETLSRREHAMLQQCCWTPEKAACC
jgi:hypothetical protein